MQKSKNIFGEISLLVILAKHHKVLRLIITIDRSGTTTKALEGYFNN